MQKLSFKKEITPADYHRIKVAFWLCTFLGEIAVHRFYLRVNDGFIFRVMYIATLGFFGIGCFYDWVLLLKEYITCAKYKKAHPEKFR